MRRRDFTIGSISAVGLGRGATAEEVLRDRIARGGLVLLLRHARTEPGIGDPPGFRLDDCATQRNLSPEGRADARALGTYLRASGLLQAELRSSAWCRCRETAELLGLGQVAHEPALDSFFEDRSQAAERTVALRAILAGWPGPATLVLVTHQVNITAATGLATAMGEALLVEPTAGGRILGRLSPGPAGGPPRLEAIRG
jgi:broad specificity phosphatase PhoE